MCLEEKVVGTRVRRLLLFKEACVRARKEAIRNRRRWNAYAETLPGVASAAAKADLHSKL